MQVVEDDAGDARDVRRPGLGEREPHQLFQFLVRSALTQLHRHAFPPRREETRVEAPRSPGRRYRAGDIAQAFERWRHAMRRKPPPARFGRFEGSPAADEQARFLIGLTDGRKRDRAGAGRAKATRCRYPGFFVWMKAAGDSDAAVIGIRSATRKNELARHEYVLGVAPAHQHADFIAAPVEQHQRRGIARA